MGASSKNPLFIKACYLCQVFLFSFFLGNFNSNAHPKDFCVSGAKINRSLQNLKQETAATYDDPLVLCDTLIYMDGSRQVVKIVEVDRSTIVYKKCEDPWGSSITIKKALIKQINYSNGTSSSIVSTGKTAVMTESKGVTVDPAEKNAYRDSCVIVERKNKRLIKAKLIYYDEEEIIYTPCEGKSTQQISLEHKFIARITTLNGSKDITSRIK